MNAGTMNDGGRWRDASEYPIVHRRGLRSTSRTGWLRLPLAALGFLPALLWAQNRTADQIRADRQRAADSMERVVYRRIPDVERRHADAAGSVVDDSLSVPIELKLHILRPPNPTDGPPRHAIVFFHGGGFRTGNPDQFFIQADDFAKRGAVAFCAEYRLKDDVEVTIAEQIEDARCAIRWIRTRAAEFGVDPRRIIAAGGSAGGYLALATAMIPEERQPGDPVSPTPDALVLYNPAIDFEIYAEQQGVAAIERTLGGPIRNFSGTPNVRPGLPPTLLFQGTGDQKTPSETAVRFADLMKKHGNDCELVTFEGMEHGFHNRDPYIGQCLEKAREFLRSRGFGMK